MLDALAGFYAAVERVGKRPPEWPAHRVALLPKGGTGDPLDRRPTVLLPVVYRLWAAARAGLMRDWLRGAGVLRAGSMAAADALAGLLGLELDEDHALGQPVVGLALDFSKCYDRLEAPWRARGAPRSPLPARLA